MDENGKKKAKCRTIGCGGEIIGQPGEKIVCQCGITYTFTESGELAVVARSVRPALVSRKNGKPQDITLAVRIPSGYPPPIAPLVRHQMTITLLSESNRSL